jgi:nucleotide-binding universal stress UspA family protein
MAEMILCAVDESDAAAPVLDTARWLADALHVNAVVLHAVDAPDRDADALQALIRARLGDELADVRVVAELPAKAILKTAAQEGAELIVVGSRGRGALKSMVLGSVSREVASEARCPVVVVPPGVVLGRSDTDNASVVCGVDGSDEALAGAALAGSLARRIGLRLVVVHARQNLNAVASYPGARMATPPVTGQDDGITRLTA